MMINANQGLISTIVAKAVKPFKGLNPLKGSRCNQQITFQPLI